MLIDKKKKVGMTVLNTPLMYPYLPSASKSISSSLQQPAPIFVRSYNKVGYKMK